MRDICFAKFKVGDLLKVVKGHKGLGVEAGTILRCVRDDGSIACIFESSDKRTICYPNNHLQKL